MKNKTILVTFLIFNFCFAIGQQNIKEKYLSFVKEQKKFITNDQLSMSYIDKGKGEAILLLHGVPTSSWLYRDLIDSLVKRGKRVIVPDLIGYGQSDKPKKLTAYEFSKQAKRLFELMQKLRIDHWTQVCHDMGSLVTWKMLESDTLSKISKLVILNSILEKDNFDPPMKFRQNIIGRSYSKIYCSGLGKGMIKATLNGGMYKKRISRESLYGYVSPLKHKGHYALYYFFTNFSNTEQIIEHNRITLNNYNGNIVFIWGIHDKILKFEQIKHTINSSKTNITIVKLQDSSHFVQEQELKENLNLITSP